MTDEELIKRLHNFYTKSGVEGYYTVANTVTFAADRIEALIAERDEAMQLLQTLSNVNGDLSRDMYKTKLLLAKAVGCLTHYATCPVEEIRLEARATLAEIKSGVATTPYGLEGENHD